MSRGKGSSDGSSTVVDYLSRTLRPHLPPWLCAAGVGAAGALGSLRWEDSPAAAVGLTLASGALTAATWWAGRSTTAQRRLHSAITVAAASTWTTAAALAGPTTGVMPDMFLMGAPAVALSWNVRIALRTPDPEGTSASNAGLLEKIGLAKAKMGAPKVEPNKVRLPYAIEPGQGTNEEAAKAAGRLAGALDVPTTAVRHQPDPESAARGEFVITPVDMLRQVTWFPGPSRPGASIAEPLAIGVYDDGRPLEISLLKAIHILIMGMTGSGKTEEAMDLLCEVLTRCDVNVWLSDHVKRGQDLGAIFPACDWAVTTPQGTEAMIEAVKASIPARTTWLGAHSYRSWEPAAAAEQTDPKHSCRSDGQACGCPGLAYLLAWFEEAANTLAALGDDVFTTIAQEARSAGVSLVVSMQRASGYQISTDTRSSIPSVLCFGVANDTDAGFALPDDVLDMGANPAAWGNKRPGYVYAVAAGIAEELYATPARSFRNDPVALEWVAGSFADTRMDIDPVTAKAAASVAGRAYTGRAPERDDGAVQDDIEGDADTDLDDDSLDDEIDPEAELPPLADGADVPFPTADTGRRPSPEEARDLFARALDDFERDGVMVVGPKDFMDWCDAHGYSRPWVSARLREAYENGRLQDTGTPGRWRIVPSLTPA